MGPIDQVKAAERRARQRERARVTRDRRHERGLCVECGKPNDRGGRGLRTCSACYANHRRMQAVLKAKGDAAGMCVVCHCRPPEEGIRRCSMCREVGRKAQQRRRERLREAGICTRCTSRPVEGVSPHTGKPYTVCSTCRETGKMREKGRYARNRAALQEMRGAGGGREVQELRALPGEPGGVPQGVAGEADPDGVVRAWVPPPAVGGEPVLPGVQGLPGPQGPGEVERGEGHPVQPGGEEPEVPAAAAAGVMRSLSEATRRAYGLVFGVHRQEPRAGEAPRPAPQGDETTGESDK